MTPRLQLSIAAVMLVIDAALVALAFALAHRLRFETGIMAYQQYQPTSDYLGLALLGTVLVPASMALAGVYRFQRSPSRLDESQRILTAVSLGTVLSWAISAFATRDFNYSRALMAFAWALSVVLIWTAHALQHWLLASLLRRGVIRDKVLVVGTGEMGRSILQHILNSPQLGYQVVGVASQRHTPGSSSVLGTPQIGGADDVGQLVREHGVSEVIVAEPSLSHQRLMAIVEQCDDLHVTVKVFPDVFQMISSPAAIGDLNGLPLVSVRDAALRGWNLALKRIVDLVFAAIVLVLLSPLLLTIAFLVKLTSLRGPIMYVQERVGLDGVPFRCLKFRSMRVAAEAETGPVWSSAGDSRVTLLGRLLRRSSLDEVPQFINVLFGEMSLVGPRPERPHFVEQFSQRVPRYWERHKVKAGITGWAQVNGLRGNVSIEERTAYDLWYVENWTLWLDFKIMLRTLVSIFRSTNA